LVVTPADFMTQRLAYTPPFHLVEGEQASPPSLMKRKKEAGISMDGKLRPFRSPLKPA
jgi:hypothetical protein